jgi:hypothetical protein
MTSYGRRQPGGAAVATRCVEHSERGRQLEKVVGPSCRERAIEEVLQHEVSAKLLPDINLWTEYFSGLADKGVSGCSPSVVTCTEERAHFITDFHGMFYGLVSLLHGFFWQQLRLPLFGLVGFVPGFVEVY